MGEELATGEDEEAVPKDAIFHLLAHPRRRELLAYLQRHDEPLPVADVAEAIAIHEQDKDIQEIPAEEVKRIYMSLYHNHIPKLEDHDITVYNQAKDMVALAENATALAPYLELADKDTSG